MFGPCGTQILGDFGAEVIKVEKPGSGDLSRGIDRLREHPGLESANFLAMNRNKKSIAIDLKSDGGRALLKEIASKSDVFVHNFRPGVIERMGLGYEDVKALKPDIIYVAGSGFGASGPLVDKGGMDFVAQAISGIAHGNKDPDGKPQLFPVSASDFSSGMLLVQSVLLALLHRGRTGEGQKVDINLLDVYLVMQQQEVTQKLRTGKDFNPLVQDPMDIFATSDGYISVIAVFKPNPVSDICRALEIADITAEPEFATLALQMSNRKEYRRRMSEGFAKFTTEECARRLDQVDILNSPVLALGESLAHPQVLHNDILIELDHPTAGTVKTVGNAIKSSAYPEIALNPPPVLGQHSAEVLREMGYEEERIAELLAQRIVNQARI
jgi:formyl-CoA transferase